MPNSLLIIVFGDNFNKSLNNVIFSENLQTIKCGPSFNQCIDDVIFPNSLKKLILFVIHRKMHNIPIFLEEIHIIHNNGKSLNNITKIPFGCKIYNE